MMAGLVLVQLLIRLEKKIIYIYIYIYLYIELQDIFVKKHLSLDLLIGFLITTK